MKASISPTGFAGERCYLVIAGEVEIRVLHTGATKKGHCSIAVGGGIQVRIHPRGSTAEANFVTAGGWKGMCVRQELWLQILLLQCLLG